MNKSLNQSGQCYEFDVLVIGTGLAGLHYSLELLHLNPKIKIALVSKAETTNSNSSYAQGGIAAVANLDDSLDLHFADTIAAVSVSCNRSIFMKILMYLWKRSSLSLADAALVSAKMLGYKIQRKVSVPEEELVMSEKLPTKEDRDYIYNLNEQQRLYNVRYNLGQTSYSFDDVQRAREEARILFDINENIEKLSLLIKNYCAFHSDDKRCYYIEKLHETLTLVNQKNSDTLGVRLQKLSYALKELASTVPEPDIRINQYTSTSSEIDELNASYYINIEDNLKELRKNLDSLLVADMASILDEPNVDSILESYNLKKNYLDAYHPHILEEIVLIARNKNEEHPENKIPALFCLNNALYCLELSAKKFLNLSQYSTSSVDYPLAQLQNYAAQRSLELSQYGKLHPHEKQCINGFLQAVWCDKLSMTDRLEVIKKELNNHVIQKLMRNDQFERVLKEIVMALALLIIGYLFCKAYDVVFAKNNIASCVFFKPRGVFEDLNNISDCAHNLQKLAW